MRVLILLIALALPALPQQLVRVLSYNIHHGEGTDAKIDLPRIAAIINSVKPDLVALQEVDVRTKRSLGVDQLLELAHLTGLQPISGPSISYQGGFYGNAVLTRLPVSGFINHDLPGREPRGLLEAFVTPSPGSTAQRLHFLATHLDLNEPDRLASAARIRAVLIERPAGLPMILAGDMNAVIGSKPISALLADWTLAQGGQPLFTSPASSPRRQIDFILVRPAARWRVIETRVLEEPVASDHRPIFAVLELLPGPAPESPARPDPPRNLR